MTHEQTKAVARIDVAAYVLRCEMLRALPDNPQRSTSLVLLDQVVKLGIAAAIAAAPR